MLPVPFSLSVVGGRKKENIEQVIFLLLIMNQAMPAFWGACVALLILDEVCVCVRVYSDEVIVKITCNT